MVRHWSNQSVNATGAGWDLDGDLMATISASYAAGDADMQFLAFVLMGLKGSKQANSKDNKAPTISI